MIERGNETSFNWRGYQGDDFPVQWYFRTESELPVAVQAWTIEPGVSEGLHTHHDDRPLEELYIVVAGEAEADVDGTVTTLGPGDAFLAKVGAAHDVRNIGDTPLRMIVVWGPPGESIGHSYQMGQAADHAPAPTAPNW